MTCVGRVAVSLPCTVTPRQELLGSVGTDGQVQAYGFSRVVAALFVNDE